MANRIYNTGHRWLQTFEPLSQEEILNCPEFFALSWQDIFRHKDCPDFMKKIIAHIPWSHKDLRYRNNVIQVKPQDFRVEKPKLLGEGIHLDMNVLLKDGRARHADNLDDFKLFTVSFGGVVETEFVSDPMELQDLDEPGTNYLKFFEALPSNLNYHSPAPNQLAQYTSLDLHRMGKNFKLGNARLLIVAFECNKPLADGIVLPSILKRNGIKFEDYNNV